MTAVRGAMARVGLAVPDFLIIWLATGRNGMHGCAAPSDCQSFSLRGRGMNDSSPYRTHCGGLMAVVLGLFCCAGIILQIGCGSGNNGSSIQRNPSALTAACPHVAQQAATITAAHAPQVHTADVAVYRLPPIEDSGEVLPWKIEMPAEPVAEFDALSDEPQTPEVSAELPGSHTSGGFLTDYPLFPPPNRDLDLESTEPSRAEPEPAESGQVAPELTDSVPDADVPNNGEGAVPPFIVASPDTLDVHRAEARKIVQRAFSLANRGMLYSARREFLRALRTLAHAKDASVGGREFSRKLSSGIRTLDESDDFLPHGSQLESEMYLETIVSSHHTSLLKNGCATNVSPPAAIEAYHDQVADQLGMAMAGEPAGSMALYGLARIHQHFAMKDAVDSMANVDKAVALHRAALLAHPRNHLAANEAGVLLARQGRLVKATSMLERAAYLAPTSVGHHNLAAVQLRRGQHKLANATAKQARILSMQQQTAADRVGAGVAWVDPRSFVNGTVPNSPAVAAVLTHPPMTAPQPRRATAPRGPQWLRHVLRR